MISGTKIDALQELTASAMEQADNAIIKPIACNLSQIDTIDALVNEVFEFLGGLDILICNAGMT